MNPPAEEAIRTRLAPSSSRVQDALGATRNIEASGVQTHEN